MKLEKITENTYCISGKPIWVSLRRREAILIDSGNDEIAGRRIFQLLKKKWRQLSWIINTHSNY